MDRKRDYKREYQIRLNRAKLRGFSRSQARGHAKAGETPIRAPPERAATMASLEAALKAFRRSHSQSRAASEVGVSAERFRKFLRENELARREGRKWVFTDQRTREITAITTSGIRHLEVEGFEPASLIGRHSSAVKTLLDTNDLSVLAPFLGATVKDRRGKTHALETRPNTLYRLAAADGEGFEQIYRLTN
jgi:hypothetical protein